MSARDGDDGRDAAARPGLKLSRREVLGSASAGVIVAGTLPSWLAVCVKPEQRPWADGTYWSDGTGWIDDRGWPYS